MFAAGETETVVLVRPPQRDPYGDPIPGTAVEMPVDGCLFAPGPSAEMLNGANQVDIDGTVYMPPSVVIEASDRLRVRGDDYEVVGRPRRWDSVGLEVVVRLVTG